MTATLIGVGFGLVWMLIAALALHAPARSVAGAAAICAAIAVGLVVARVPQRQRPQRARNQKLLKWSIGVEFAVIACGLPLCMAYDRADLILPVVGLAVGLHFIPMAQAFGQPILIATGLLTIAVAILSLWFDQSDRPIMIGFGTGASLWATILLDTWRKRPSGGIIPPDRPAA